MSEQKWQVGPVNLVCGWDAVVHRFCERRQQYIGEIRDGSGSWFAREWNALGHYALGIGEGDAFNLVPPPKKTTRFMRFICLYRDCWTSHLTKEEAMADMGKDVFAMIEIDREVEEGEGLNPNMQSRNP